MDLDDVWMPGRGRRGGRGGRSSKGWTGFKCLWSCCHCVFFAVWLTWIEMTWNGFPGRPRKQRPKALIDSQSPSCCFSRACMQSSWDLHASACRFWIFCRLLHHFNMFLARLFRCREDWSTLANNRDFATPCNQSHADLHSRCNEPSDNSPEPLWIIPRHHLITRCMLYLLVHLFHSLSPLLQHRRDLELTVCQDELTVFVGGLPWSTSG